MPNELCVIVTNIHHQLIDYIFCNSDEIDAVVLDAYVYDDMKLYNKICNYAEFLSNSAIKKQVQKFYHKNYIIYVAKKHNANNYELLNYCNFLADNSTIDDLLSVNYKTIINKFEFEMPCVNGELYFEINDKIDIIDKINNELILAPWQFNTYGDAMYFYETNKINIELYQ